MAVPAELFAVAAAGGFAANYTIAKRALQRGSVIGGVLVSLFAALAVLTIATLLTGPHRVDGSAAGLFVLGGVVASGLGTAASIAGIHRLGASVSVPIEQGTRPIVAVVLAAIILNESITVRQVAGIAAIVLGAMTISRVIADDGGETRGGLWRSMQGLASAAVAPLVAGACYAGGDVIGRVALPDVSHPAFGATINMASAVTVWVLAATLVPAVRRNVRFGGTPLFALGGVFIGLALLSLYQALDAERVTLVTPIMASQPLAVLLLSVLILRDIEHFGPRTIVAAGLIVVGNILVLA